MNEHIITLTGAGLEISPVFSLLYRRLAGVTLLSIEKAF